MSTYVLVICWILAGQVNNGGGRYSGAPAVTNPFNQNGPATSTPTTGSTATGNTSEALPTGGSFTQGAAVPGGGGTSPYGKSTLPIGSGDANQPPGLLSSPSGDSRSMTAPPPSTSPWSTNTPAANSALAAASGLKPSAMMRAMLDPRGESRLTGSRLALADVVATASSRSDQTERVDAYWDLCSSVADYYLGLREQEELRRLRSQLPRVGPAYELAEKELNVRVGTARNAAVASQYRLASLIGSAGTLPLPGDAPHCADYNTYYDRIFAGRQSAEAQELATLLPLRFAELRDAASGVARAEQLLNNSATLNDTTEGEATLHALELLALRRRAFVQIARDYNRRIARYTELATPGDLGAMRLVSMLIKPAGSSTATRSSAPAPPLNRQTQAAPSPPNTFAQEGWSPSTENEENSTNLDDAVKPAAGLFELDEPPRREKSLLVSPLSELPN